MVVVVGVLDTIIDGGSGSGGNGASSTPVEEGNFTVSLLREGQGVPLGVGGLERGQQ